MNIQQQVLKLELFTRDDVRKPMGHRLGPPTVSSRIIELQQELFRTRQALKDALAIIRLLEEQ